MNPDQLLPDIFHLYDLLILDWI